MREVCESERARRDHHLSCATLFLTLRKVRVQMILPGVRASAISGEDGGLHGELLGDKGHRFGRGRAEVVWDKAHEAQGTELQRTVAAWWARSGRQGQAVHEYLIEQPAGGWPTVSEDFVRQAPYPSPFAVQKVQKLNFRGA
jgi:hypothetical protein